MKATGRVNGSKASRTAGFSFLEVVVVLVILAVLAIVVMPRIGNTPAELKAEADMLRAHLRFIQTMAMANNTCTWGIALAGGGYSMTRDGAPSPINLPGENSPTHTLSSGVRIVQGLGSHTFCQWGCPGQSLSITLSDGAQQETINILALTGLVQ